MYVADLTNIVIQATEKRLLLYGFNANFSIQNTENMTYEDNFFDHINCQGVIHHAPNINQAVKEIARVLKKGKTAYISIYYKNLFLRNWKYIKSFGKILSKFGAGLKGRGRENIFLEDDINEISRLYDGVDNPIGKAYSEYEAIQLVEKYFDIEAIYFDFFPARSLPFKIPIFLHKFLSKHFGFMILLNLRKN